MEADVTVARLVYVIRIPSSWLVSIRGNNNNSAYRTIFIVDILTNAGCILTPCEDVVFVNSEMLLMIYNSDIGKY